MISKKFAESVILNARANLAANISSITMSLAFHCFVNIPSIRQFKYKNVNVY